MGTGRNDEMCLGMKQLVGVEEFEIPFHIFIIKLENIRSRLEEAEHIGMEYLQ